MSAISQPGHIPGHISTINKYCQAKVEDKFLEYGHNISALEHVMKFTVE